MKYHFDMKPKNEDYPRFYKTISIKEVIKMHRKLMEECKNNPRESKEQSKPKSNEAY